MKERTEILEETFRKLAEDKETANAWGDWDPEKFTVEDAAFGYIVMIQDNPS